MEHLTIEKFLSLDDDTRGILIAADMKRQKVKRVRDEIADERRKLNTRETNNQISCDHPMATERYVAHENEFGNLTGGGTMHHSCPDCLLRWNTNE